MGIWFTIKIHQRLTGDNSVVLRPQNTSRDLSHQLQGILGVLCSNARVSKTDDESHTHTLSQASETAQGSDVSSVRFIRAGGSALAADLRCLEDIFITIWTGWALLTYSYEHRASVMHGFRWDWDLWFIFWMWVLQTLTNVHQDGSKEQSKTFEETLVSVWSPYFNLRNAKCVRRPGKNCANISPFDCEYKGHTVRHISIYPRCVKQNKLRAWQRNDKVCLWNTNVPP